MGDGSGDVMEMLPRKRRAWYLVPLIAVGVFLLAAGLCLNSLARVHELANRQGCSSNIRQLGQAILLYGEDFGGVLPADLQTLIKARQFPPECLTCPSTADTKSVHGELGQGHCSFVYVGPERARVPLSEGEVVVIEDPANHKLDGANVLYGDGSASFEPIETIVRYLDGLEAGENPPVGGTVSRAQAVAEYRAKWQGRMGAMKAGVWKREESNGKR